MTESTHTERLFKYQNLTTSLLKQPTEVGIFVNSRQKDCPIMFVPERAEFICATDKNCLYEIVGDLLIITSEYTLHRIEATVKYNPDKPIGANEFLKLEPITTYSINLAKIKDKTSLLLYKFISDSWENAKQYVEVTL